MVTEEQRRAIRIPSSRPVVMLINQQSAFGTMTDFSMHGIGFMVNAKVAKNDKVEVHFDIPSQKAGVKSFQFKAFVQHCTPISHESHVGVALESPTPEYIQVFNQLVE